MSKKAKDWSHLLKYYSQPGRRQSQVRRAYASYRKENGLPIRCDIEECPFHTEPLVWNGQSFRPILDHKSGSNRDNTPQNLRYLCPICNAQQPTHGGGNKGKVKHTAMAYTVKHADK